MEYARPASLCRMMANATSVPICKWFAETTARMQAAFRALQAKLLVAKHWFVGADWPIDRAWLSG
eukprot:15431000-Alexandrium_andersonii.AAC.1